LRKSKLQNAGSLAYKNPKLAKEWHPTKNGYLKPQDITSGVDHKVWWLCSTCGHEWEAAVCRRVWGIGECPKCNNSLAKKNPKLALEWHPIKNGALKPHDVLRKSRQRVWWLCSDCGQEWMSSVERAASAHTRDGCGFGCPDCRKSRKMRAADHSVILNSGAVVSLPSKQSEDLDA
jgi:predicted RNA-binding Zn-ribbon protein involved in translation (DUF1610 family)